MVLERTKLITLMKLGHRRANATTWMLVGMALVGVELGCLGVVAANQEDRGLLLGGTSQPRRRPASERSTTRTRSLREGGRSSVSEGSFPFGDETHDYRLVVPEGARNLVVMLHGGGGTFQSTDAVWHVGEVAEAGGFVALIPNGHVGLGGRYTWNGGHCCGPAAIWQLDSVGYLSALISSVQEQHKLEKLWVAGHSNGAVMAYKFQEDTPLDVEGIAVFSGTVGGRRRSGHSWELSRLKTKGVVHVHGAKDRNIHYYGGVTAAFQGPERGRIDDSFEESRARVQRLGGLELLRVDEKPGYTTELLANAATGTIAEFVTIREWGHRLHDPSHATPDLATCYPGGGGCKQALTDALIELGAIDDGK